MNTKPSIITKIRNFAKALYNHIITGMKKSSQKEINRRYGICLDCDYLEVLKVDRKQSLCRCNLCGCTLSNSKKYLMNKLAWKDQQCPDDKW